MAGTGCKAEMKFIDVTALADAAVTVSTAQSIGNLSLFSNDMESTQKEYGTLELNQFILDGSKTVMPAAPKDIAFWSEQKSGDACTFSSNPTFAAAFKTNHSSGGVTLYFADDYPAEVKVSYYSAGGSKIKSSVFYPDGLIYVCRDYVTNFQRVVIEFQKTRLPNRYIKLQYVLYGLYLQWQDDLIQSASVHEEIDETGSTLAINTASIAIVDENNDFDFGNENGAWKAIQKTQEVTLTEKKDGKEIPVGTYFLDKKSFQNNIASFDLIDRIGLMDNYKFRDGERYDGETVGNILKAIFRAAGVTKYEIEEEVAKLTVSGCLKIMSCREALQMVCFAVGAVADCQRSDMIKVFMPNRYVSSNVGTDRKFNGNTQISLDEYISGVSIEVNGYAPGTESTELYNDTLISGENTIEFSNPVDPDTISVKGGTLVTAKTNYAVIKMSKTGTCVISGREYTETSIKYVKNVSQIDAGESENIKEFSGITLYNMELIADRAESLLKYYLLRKMVSMRYLVNAEKVGDWVTITDRNRNVSATLIESQDLDLTGGFIATASCRGYSMVTSDYYFTGTELYSGQEGII